MRQPVFKIWGHAPRAPDRADAPPVDCDVEAVLDAVAVSRAAIEVNGDPHRLDLEPRWLRAARERGIRFVISTDAHSTAELGNTRYGVLTARRGWVRRGEVLNARPVEEFRAAVRPARAAGVLSRVFLLSPASCHGERARLLLRDEACFDLALRLRGEGAPLGEVFSFLSGLYFRGKLAYARAFAASAAAGGPVSS